MILSRFRCTAVLLAVCSFAPLAKADSPADDLHLNVTAPTPDVPFPKGTMAVVSWASYTPPIRYSSDHLVTGALGLSYYFAKNHAVNVVATGFHVDQLDGDTAEGTGLSIMGRYHFFNRERFTVFFDGGIGYTWANSAIPEGGTTYNFCPRVGFGAGYQLSENVWLTAGARYLHMSNARAHGPDKNPGYDGAECYVGFIWTLP